MFNPLEEYIPYNLGLLPNMHIIHFTFEVVEGWILRSHIAEREAYKAHDEDPNYFLDE